MIEKIIILNIYKLIENLEKSIHLLKYNVNIDLVLDKLFIELRNKMDICGVSFKENGKIYNFVLEDYFYKEISLLLKQKKVSNTVSSSFISK